MEEKHQKSLLGALSTWENNFADHDWVHEKQEEFTIKSDWFHNLIVHISKMKIVGSCLLLGCFSLFK